MLDTYNDPSFNSNSSDAREEEESEISFLEARNEILGHRLNMSIERSKYLAGQLKKLAEIYEIEQSVGSDNLSSQLKEEKRLVLMPYLK